MQLSRAAAVFAFLASPALALAQATTEGGPVKVGPGGAPGANPAGPSWAMPLMMIGMFAFMYLFLIRPQAKRQKEHQNFLKELAPGTEVITSGGLVGRITNVSDTIVTVDLGSSTVRVLKSAVTGRLDAGAVPAKA